MTEQIEDDFWAQERARAVAERGRQADPSACGTCKTSVAAGGHVKHDECAQRATLLPAPDAPGYELITGMAEEEVWALPARFHIPAFVEPVRAWVCAVCWGDGWSTQWPCKTATEQGLRVFTADDYAETRAKREAAELAEHRAEATTPLVVDRFDVAMEAAPEEEPGLTIGAIAENGRSVALVFDEEMRLKVAGWLTPVVELEVQLAEARARVAELENELAEQTRATEYFSDQSQRRKTERDEARAELKKYVGVEPTIAEEMAYLSRCIDSVLDLCTATEQQATRWENPLPVPEWVATVRAAASGDREAAAVRPVLPWAFALDAADRRELVSELSLALLGYWHNEPDTDVLARVESVLREQRANAGGRELDPMQLPDLAALRQALRVRNAQLARLRTEMTGGAR